MNNNSNNKFKSLNGLRKYYLILLWAITISVFSTIVFLYLTNSHKITFGTVVLSALFVALTAWTHNAIINRKIIHIKIIAFINLIPFFNIVSTILMLSIADTTRKEINNKNV